ncbi:hypothetical protein LINGRAHAP2_LOCUS14476 [Linum grandiflorum]
MCVTHSSSTTSKPPRQLTQCSRNFPGGMCCNLHGDEAHHDHYLATRAASRHRRPSGWTIPILLSS